MKATSPSLVSTETEAVHIKEEPPDEPMSPEVQSNNCDVLGYCQKHYPMAGGTLFSVFSPLLPEANSTKSSETKSRRGRPRGPRKAPGFIQEISGHKSHNIISPKCSIPQNSNSSEAHRPAALRDLPYMGQLTLNTKPRRGRKPKKTDICHLISKNYGISIPKQLEISEVKSLSETTAKTKTKPAPNSYETTKETDSSSPPPPDFLPVAVKLEEPDYWDNDCNLEFDEQDEPLNLCLRDTDEIPKNEMESIEEQPVISEKDLRYVRDGSNVWLMNQLGLFGSFPFNFRDPPKFPNSSLLYDALRGHPQVKKEETTVSENFSSVETPNPVQESSQIPVDNNLSSPSDTESDLKYELPRKCKRSPIYVPPTAKAPAEVSICKFKFTGGAKPTLEKKKMLSVDAVGNFHFYSSTPQKNDETPDLHPSTSQQFYNLDRPIRKRRSKKSVLRKKLEQTFRDQGFLIQTQQFEAPQGATFCKFRQLKKFTRYLFRSWKEYLPDNIHGMAPQEDLSPSHSNRSPSPEDSPT